MNALEMLDKYDAEMPYPDLMTVQWSGAIFADASARQLNLVERDLDPVRVILAVDDVRDDLLVPVYTTIAPPGFPHERALLLIAWPGDPVLLVVAANLTDLQVRAALLLLRLRAEETLRINLGASIVAQLQAPQSELVVPGGAAAPRLVRN